MGLFFLFVNFPLLWAAFVFLFFGFWIPQIVANAMRNSSRQIDWSYILLGSFARVLPLVYFCFTDRNFLQTRVRNYFIDLLILTHFFFF
jgi:hypothetical protein